MIFFITKGKLSYYTKRLWRFIALSLHIINKPDKFNMFIYFLKPGVTWLYKFCKTSGLILLLKKYSHWVIKNGLWLQTYKGNNWGDLNLAWTKLTQCIKIASLKVWHLFSKLTVSN